MDGFFCVKFLVSLWCRNFQLINMNVKKQPQQGAHLTIITGASAKIPNSALTAPIDPLILCNANLLRSFVETYKGAYIRLLPYRYSGGTWEDAKKNNLFSNYILLDFDKTIEGRELHELGQAKRIFEDIKKHPNKYNVTICKYSNSGNLHLLSRVATAPRTATAYRLQYQAISSKFIEVVKERTGINLEVDRHLGRAGQGLRLVSSDIIFNDIESLNELQCAQIQAEANNIDQYGRDTAINVVLTGHWSEGKQYEDRPQQNHEITPNICNAIMWLCGGDEQQAHNVAHKVFGANFVKLEIFDKLKTASKIVRSNKKTNYFTKGIGWLKSNKWYIEEGRKYEGAKEIKYRSEIILKNKVTLNSVGEVEEHSEYLSDHYTEITKEIEQSKCLQIVAPVGVGKTHFIKRFTGEKIREGKTTLILNFLNVLSTTYTEKLNLRGILSDLSDFYNFHDKIYTYYGKNALKRLKTHNFEKCSAIANIASVKSIDILDLEDIDYIVIDEIHKMYLDQFRGAQMETLRRFIVEAINRGVKVVAMTGTPIEEFDNIFDFVRVTRTDEAKEKKHGFHFQFVQGFTMKNLHKYLPQLHRQQPRTKIVVLYNNTKKCAELAQAMNEYGIKSDYITQPADREAKKYLIEKEKLHPNTSIFFCTSIINEGLNINDKDNEVIYITDIENIKNPYNLIQLGGRSRQQSKKIILGYNNESNFDISTQRTFKEPTEGENIRLNDFATIATKEDWIKRIKRGTDNFYTITEGTKDNFLRWYDSSIILHRDKPTKEDAKAIYQYFLTYKGQGTEIKQIDGKIIDTEGKIIRYNDTTLLKKIRDFVEGGYILTGNYIQFANIYEQYRIYKTTTIKKGLKEVSRGKQHRQLTARQTKIVSSYPKTWEALNSIGDTPTRTDLEKLDNILAIEVAEHEQRAIEQRTQASKANVTFYYEGKEYIFESRIEAIEKEFYRVIGVSKKDFKQRFKAYKMRFSKPQKPR